MVGEGILEAKRDLHIDYLWFDGAFENKKKKPSPLVEVRRGRFSGVGLLFLSYFNFAP